jgi:tripartite ATP-independent transporter DctP family solute receptor
MSMRLKIAAFAAGLMLVAPPSMAQEWRGWNTHTADYPNGVGMDRWAELVTQRSQGRIRMRTFHSSQLGQQDEAIQQLRLGAIDFANFNLSPLNNLVPETQVLTLPFVFRDEGHLHRTVDGPIGEELAQKIAALNMVVVGWFDSGSRHVFNRTRPIRTPEDMRGLKIRVQTSDLWVDLIRALGANPTPLPFGEVYTALQSGVIDGAENNWPSYQNMRFFEVARHITTTAHSNVPEILVVSKLRWDRLNEADRALVRAAAREASALQRQLWAEREKTSRAATLAAGSQLVEITDHAPWAAAMAPVYEKYAGREPLKGLLERIRAQP